jgi:hypothetical protein
MKKIFNVIIGFLGAIGFLWVGMWIFVWDIGKLQQASDSRDWPQADGTITISTIEMRGDEHRPHVEYTYTVAGIPYTSRQISFDIFDKPGGQGRIESIMARYPVGKAVTVYCDPNNPATAILEPEDYSPFYSPLLPAIIFFAGGLLTLGTTFRLLIYGQLPMPEELSKKVQLVCTVFFSVMVYSIFVLVSLESGPREIAILAFGQQPLGIPNLFFVLALQTLLYLPVPWIFWHALKVAWQGKRDGKGFSIGYLFADSRYHPELWVSRWVCIGGLFYFIAICAAWIVYASILGI